jgi:AraC-like DNA-binding protein
MDYVVQPYHGGACILFVDKISDMQLLEVGYSHPGHCTSGPLYRECFCLHFVLEGSCQFNDRTMHSGEAFLMPPGRPNRLITHADYKHTWIIFQGSVAQAYLRSTRIPPDGLPFEYAAFSLEPELERLRLLFELPGDGALFEGKSILFSIFAKCALPRSESLQPTDYIDLASKFLENHYTETVSSADVARYIGLSQKHLCRIYKHKTGETVQETLCRLRLEAAKNLLKTTDYSIGEIAAILGFADPLYFSRFIKSMTGDSPTDLRKLLVLWKNS